jgi:hypothetical protein
MIYRNANNWLQFSIFCFIVFKLFFKNSLHKLYGNHLNF